MEGDFGRRTRSLRNCGSRLYSRISGSVNLEFALWCLLDWMRVVNGEVVAEIRPSPPLRKGGELHWRTLRKGERLVRGSLVGRSNPVARCYGTKGIGCTVRLPPFVKGDGGGFWQTDS